MVAGCLLLACSLLPAQVPVAGTVLSKVIKAIDLKVQAIQNETLVLQNIQRVIENNLHLQKLAEISDWSFKQKELYRKYFEELSAVKPAVDSLFHLAK